jgi:hypothetical protein
MGNSGTMPEYKDLVEMAQICVRHSRTARNSEVSAQFLRLAGEYELRAAQKRPCAIDEPRAAKKTRSGLGRTVRADVA